MGVELVEVVSPELVDAMNMLLPQLSRSATEMSVEDVEAVVHQEGVYVFIYRSGDDDKILGMLSLATFRIPTGLRAWIEDVVVHEDARGHGAGQQLVHEATEYAKKLGVKSVDLTSRPSREAANRLYMRCGFNPRETNVYRYSDVD